MKSIILAIIALFILNNAIFTQISGWYFQNPKPTNMGINSVKFLTQNDIIAVGYYGTVIKSTDAGITWSNPFTTTLFRGLENLVYWNTSFINPSTGFMTGNNAGIYTKIYKTTNAGNFWVLVSTFGLLPAVTFTELQTEAARGIVILLLCLQWSGEYNLSIH
jgi:photosystem II stability/assembly factor-like uncharacterized protein